MFHTLLAAVVAGNGQQAMKTALIVICLILAVLVVASIASTLNYSKMRRKRKADRLLLMVVYIATLIVTVCAVFAFVRYTDFTAKPQLSTPGNTTTEQTENSTTTETTVETTVATEPDYTLEAGYTDKTNPENWNVKWEILQNNKVVNSYARRHRR